MDADLGTTIKVKVSFTDDASNAETLTSAATAAVSAAPNTLPSASNGTVTTNEDNAHTFTASEFNFTDADGDTLSNVRIVTLPASGKGTLALSGTPVTANQVVAATNIGTLAYTPPANANGTGYASFTFKVSDGTAESAADYTMTITVTAVNDAPTVANTIPDQPATVGTAFSYAFPANTFSDADTGDMLTYAATKADGATLPTWMGFAAGTRTFSGTPQTADVGTVSVKVTASDGNGGSVSGEFDITVSAAANNLATGAPTITGTAQVGQTLTAGTTGIMDADGLTSVSYAYQWIRVATDNTETNISGATASTHTLVAADLGTTVKVTVSFTDDASNPETLTSTATVAVSAAPNTPATGAPTITGTAQVGQTLTAGTTAIMDAEGLTTPSYTYQWIRVATDNSETNIASATASTYTLVDADLGTTIKVKVSFTDDASNAETLTSNVSVIIARPANTAATGKPGITGTAQVGQTLTATVGTSADVDGLPNPFLTDVNTSFQWIRVATDNTETNIASATASTYTLVDADLGTTIKVKVGFADYYDYDETLTSDATAAVAASTNTPATGAPTITGTAQVGQTLTAVTTGIMDDDGLTNVSYAYQWIRVDGGAETNISGATASTYTPVTADRGKTVKVKVSFTDDASNPETLTSTATVAVSAAPNTPATGAPAITGTAQVGQTLTAGTTAIVDADGLTSVSYTYQWITGGHRQH